MTKFEGGDNSKNNSGKPADSNPLGMEAFEKPKTTEQPQQKAEAPKTLDTSAFADKSKDQSSDSALMAKMEEAQEKQVPTDAGEQREVLNHNNQKIQALPSQTTTSIANKITALSTPDGRAVVKEGVVTAYNDMSELPKMAAKMLHPGNPNPPIDPISAAAGSSWAAHTKTIEAIV